MTADPAVNTGDRLLHELRAALESGDAGTALASIRSMPDQLRSQFDIMAHEADLTGKLGRHDDEIGLLRQLIAREPDLPSLHVSLAQALKVLGHRDEAIAAARHALGIRPDDGPAWWTLADLKTYRFDEAEAKAMENALAGSIAEADRRQIHFALGRALEQRGEAEAAFAHYAAGNAPAAAAALDESATLAARVDRAIGIFTPEFFAARQDHGEASDAPIFIVGLHRSGSTLVEQILASHSAVEATSELPIIAQLLRSVAFDTDLPDGPPMVRLAHLDADRARALGAEYLRRAREYRGTDKPRFVDKMPANWLYLGFIQLILPNATIIDARRHPMAAGFSNFRQFYGMGAGWTFSLDSIGRYYRDYLRLMRHFDQVLPGKVHRVIHEQLVEDFEAQARSMLAHAGLDFEPAVLEFHRSGRPVRSASADQVRQPINRDGVDQWRAFEPWLEPLKQALGDALEDWQR